MPSAKVVTVKKDGVLHVVVSGYIGEGAELFELNYVEVKKIVLDLSGVTYMNSVGVKNWILWTSRFPKGLIIELHNCPSLIVSQVNMVAGFLPNEGTVESLSAPYVCNDCSREESVHLSRGKDYQYASMSEGYKFNAPKILCPKCKQPMELDSIESKFFNFLKSIRS
jgi:hypothetical protein